MNLEVAKKRYKNVFRPDVINSSQGDFLATHVPMKNLYVTGYASPTAQDKKHPMSELEVFEKFFSPSDEDQFVLVKGASGAGKSHLIRWFYTMLQIHKQANEIVLPIRRADNTLKGTIKQLIEMPEVKNLPNKELYKKLASASTTIPEIELKNTIYYTFVNLIESDDGRAGEEGERMINRVDRQHLVALLQNSLFKEKLMDEDGPIERIYCKFAENKTTEVNDKAPEFVMTDFEIDSEFWDDLINSGADEKARKIANKLLDNDEFIKRIVDYINLFVEKVIQRCSGLEPGDLGLVIQEIRQELYKQGKILTILIEDITAASGVDDSLLDALLTNKKGYSDKRLCRINSIVGSTDGYYVDKFRANTKGRIENYINVSDDMFDNNMDGLIEFFARYLNTISLSEEVVNNWLDEKAGEDIYPIHEVTLGKGWGEYKINDEAINLFPFTKNAIVFLYKNQDINQRHPRAIIRDIIEPYVVDAMNELNNFPQRVTSSEGINTNLQNEIYNRSDIDDSTKIRLYRFMGIWGNGTSDTYEKTGVLYLSGIPNYVYEQLNLPLIDGNRVEEPIVEDNQIDNVENEKNNIISKDEVEDSSQENEKVLKALKEIDRWIEDKTYKLNFGQTAGAVRTLSDARKNINAYLYSVIDWVSEGVSVEAMNRVKDKFLVAFERQKMKSDAAILLPASIESRKIIEAFIRWSEEGKKSWNFSHSTDYLLRVQIWTEKVKPLIIKSVVCYDGVEVDYFSYAVASEYYRLIFNGDCKNFQSPQNFTVDMLLQKNRSDNSDNGHSKNWNDLRKKLNGSDGIEIRNCVLQYYNLPQGTAANSTNYEFDYISFSKAVRKVISNGLKYSDSDLQLDDPIRKRRIISEHLKHIIDRIDNVVEEEQRKLADCLDKVSGLIDFDEIEDEMDIKDIISEIKKFYLQAQKSHVSVAFHFDSLLINTCNKNAGAILSAIKTIKQINETSDVIELLLRFSRDPVFALDGFVKLVEMTGKDIVVANKEIESRINSDISSDSSTSETQYIKEKENIQLCKELLTEVKGNVN